MAEQEQDRSEQATPYKLQEARRRGSVARSLELGSVFALLAIAAVVELRGFGIAREHAQMHAALLSQAYALSFADGAVARWLPSLWVAALHSVLPLFLLLMAVAIIGTLVQTGPVFSTKAIEPDLDRINPVSGFKRVFSLRLLFELVKNLVKLALLGAAVVWLLLDLWPALQSLLITDPVAYLGQMQHWVARAVFTLAMVFAFIALLDTLYTRWQYAQKLKMSRREVKEELKQREGDPRLRARTRELQRELVKRAAAIKRLPDADVLITNPTHLAVALQYRQGEMDAPLLLAKGAGEFAVMLRELAQRHRVPVIENAPLARALFADVDIDRTIPERHFAAVARILVRAYALRRGRERSA